MLSHPCAKRSAFIFLCIFTADRKLVSERGRYIHFSKIPPILHCTTDPHHIKIPTVPKGEVVPQIICVGILKVGNTPVSGYAQNPTAIRDGAFPTNNLNQCEKYKNHRIAIRGKEVVYCLSITIASSNRGER
jgi:hypothetical protein